MCKIIKLWNLYNYLLFLVWVLFLCLFKMEIVIGTCMILKNMQKQYSFLLGLMGLYV